MWLNYRQPITETVPPVAVLSMGPVLPHAGLVPAVAQPLPQVEQTVTLRLSNLTFRYTVSPDAGPIDFAAADLFITGNVTARVGVGGWYLVRQWAVRQWMRGALHNALVEASPPQQEL
jgi:hypothetical protein